MEYLSESERAKSLDEADPLRHLREEFIIPSRADLKRKTLQKSVEEDGSSIPSTYLCGNSLGLQPRLTSTYLSQYLSTWATKGVYGHFKPITDSPLLPWLHVDDAVTSGMSKLVGAHVNEVAVMQTLTANLHLLLATFYRPTPYRHKIIIESKAFPSDHYAIESHLKHHHRDPAESMICIEPPAGTSLIPTSHILDTIRQHADTTALVLLPGIQFYTGQYLDIPTITREVHAMGLPIGWDLAHAVGNVPLELHAWDVDFAAWCMYKYLNCGPGCSGGLFVHRRHSSQRSGHLTRLAGWWGSSKTSRFSMTNRFEPIPGAAGWQLSNPSVLDLTSVQASLAVFGKTDMAALRAKSVRLTGWLEELLSAREGWFGVITPRVPEQRGAQLSVLLAEGLLDPVMEVLEEEGCVVDERRPDVIRVAPAPMYNTFVDVRRFVVVFEDALKKAVEVRKGMKDKGEIGESVMVHGGEDSRGWSEIK
ncbi:kynureninase [Viridothelium virens]|uniref:Kynureninase n=1 Tax=Viridothelium virens TaxID=1048519 RepID=A0A6A6HBJ6_VIRVR|nr:kynureninase [Viridothelium virens]